MNSDTPHRSILKERAHGHDDSEWRRGPTALFVLYITNDTVVIEALRQRAGSGKMPDWWAPLKGHFTIVGDVEVALTYLATATFAAALRSVGWFGKTASWVFEGLSLIAVPFVMPYLLGVHLVRRAGDTAS